MARILFVEDDHDVRALLTAALVRDDHQVVGAANGLEALSRLGGDGPFDLVVLDLLMPTLSGWELLAHLRGDPMFARLPVLVTSALAPQREQLSGAAFLRKPFELDVMLSEVRRLARAPV